VILQEALDALHVKPGLQAKVLDFSNEVLPLPD
jgi:hypothetical protein